MPRGPPSIIPLSVMHVEEALYLCQAVHSRKAIPLTLRESYWYNTNPFANTITYTNPSCCQDPWGRSEEKSRWSLGFSRRASKYYILMGFFAFPPWTYVSAFLLQYWTTHTSFNHFFILFGVINWRVYSTAWNKKDFFYHMLQ